MEDKNYLFIEKNDKNTLIIAFAGHAQKFGEIQPFEFVKLLEKLFPMYSKYFFIDKSLCSYHNGIKDFSTDIDSTVVYLKSIISAYDKVIFLGVSAGGHASILYGTLLNIDTVIGFKPYTTLNTAYSNKNYSNLQTILKEHSSNKTKYHLYGSLSDKSEYHNIGHCENIEMFDNVHVYKYPYINLPEMKANGELEKILIKHITLQSE